MDRYVSCRKPTEDSANWPAYTLQDEQYISLSPEPSVKKNMLSENMAFWNSLVSSLTEPEPTVIPTAPPTTEPVPVTIGPTGQKEAVASKSKNASSWFYTKCSRASK